MKQVLLEKPQELSVQEVCCPRPGPGEVLLRIRKVGLCGSDMHLYHFGQIGEIGMQKPLILGHECVGEVTEVGEGVSADLVGCRVAVEPAIPCGRCRWCTKGLHNVCPEIQFLGLPPRQGALQEYLVHPAHLLQRLPEGIGDEAGVVLEPMAIALHAVNLMKVKPGQNVVILGTGVLGTCVLALLRLREGLRITCVDLLPERLERARRMSAAATIRPRGDSNLEVAEEIKAVIGGEGADIVFECAGVNQTLWNMCEVAAPAGHIAVIGSSPEQDRVTFSSSAARRKGVTLRFVRRSLNTLPQVIRLTEEGLLQPAALVTHIFAASEVERAFATVSNYADGVLKAVVDMSRWWNEPAESAQSRVRGAGG